MWTLTVKNVFHVILVKYRILLTPRNAWFQAALVSSRSNYHLILIIARDVRPVTSHILFQINQELNALLKACTLMISVIDIVIMESIMIITQIIMMRTDNMEVIVKVMNTLRVEV